jgi:hypothetical protein
LNYPHAHPTLILVPKMVKNKQQTRLMAWNEHPSRHWTGWLPTNYKKKIFDYRWEKNDADVKCW